MLAMRLMTAVRTRYVCTRHAKVLSFAELLHAASVLLI